MLLLVFVLIALATVPLAGGRLGALADVTFRRNGLLGGALLLQVLVIVVLPRGLGDVAPAVHLASYGLAAGFLVANRTVPGIALVGLGAAANLAAIAANGGVMPADPGAIATAGIELDPTAFSNSTVVAGARLAFLGDVFAVPAGWPLANVFSVGDVVLVVGAFVGLHRICGSRLAPRARRPAAQARHQARLGDQAQAGDQAQPRQALGQRVRRAG